MNVNEFLATAANRDLLRSNRYRVFINRINPQDMLLAHAVTIPGKTNASFDYSFRGPFQKIPYQVLYEPLTITFYNYGDNEPYRSFQLWSDSMHDRQYRWRSGSFYKEDIRIEELDRLGRPVGIHLIRDAYIADIGPKQKGYGDMSNPDTFTVTFNYYDIEFQ